MLYDQTVPQFVKILGNLEQFFDKAKTHAEAKKYDASILLDMRLAPDQFALLRQVQIACDTAKLGVARLTAREAPTHEDKEKTTDELRARIHSTIAWLQTITAADFAGADERKITTPRWEGRWMTGAEFANEHVLPNFYFHVTTAYAILRHNGVDVGKRDYLGAMPFKSPETM